MSTASFLLNVLLSELYWSISISFFTLVKWSRAYERGEGPTAELGPKRNISKCLIVSSPQELSTSSLPVHSSEWVPGIAPGRRCSSVLTVSPKRKGAASFLIALKLNMMGAPRTHGQKAKWHLEIPLFLTFSGWNCRNFCALHRYAKCQHCHLCCFQRFWNLLVKWQRSASLPHLLLLQLPPSALWPFRENSLASALVATARIRNPRELWSSSGFLEFLRPAFLLKHTCRRKVFMAYCSSVFEMYSNYLFLIKTCLL